jgi:superfamily II DNA helicase RecQ
LLDMGWLAQDENGHLVPKITPLSSAANTAPPLPSPDLFERLRAWRLAKARADNVPPFVIFSDETLRGIAALKPQTPQALLAIRGIGSAKVEKYGAEVLAIVADAGTPSEDSARTTVDKTRS